MMVAVRIIAPKQTKASDARATIRQRASRGVLELLIESLLLRGDLSS